MKWDQIEGKWKELSGKDRASWGEFTDNELVQIAGKREQLIGMLQQKYGLAREEAERQADKWAKKL